MRCKCGHQASRHGFHVNARGTTEWCAGLGGQTCSCEQYRADAEGEAQATLSEIVERIADAGPDSNSAREALKASRIDTVDTA